MIDDETLLQQFFAEHRQHMADNGFTERVMAALPAREDEAVLTLRRWRLAINTFAILSISMMLIYWGIHSWEGMQTGSVRIMSGGITLFHNMTELMEPDNVLVQLIRFLRQVTAWLPSPTQLLAIFLTILILLPITIKAALRH